MSGRQLFYAVLAVTGLAATWYFNLQFMAEAGGDFSLGRFLAEGYANNASSSLANDLSVGVIAFLVWSFSEARRLAMQRWWLYLVITFAIAFACAFPLFLLARERRLQALGEA